ncbi:MAG: hypothetical protein DHS20C05_06090 [Hyphococcus sp.]|nr:MAG: hypothetical protein DHS20C05_06090 [Marinicaulis sp.]
MNDLKTRAVRRPPPKVARAGANVIAALARKTKFVDPSLADNWPTIAGAKIASLCRPGRLTGKSGARGGKTLEIFAPSGAAAAQVQMHADELKTRLNRYLGPGSVAEISIKQTAAKLQTTSVNKYKPNDQNIDSQLNQALSSFRAAIKRRNGEK